MTQVGGGGAWGRVWGALRPMRTVGRWSAGLLSMGVVVSCCPGPQHPHGPAAKWGDSAGPAEVDTQPLLMPHGRLRCPCPPQVAEGPQGVLAGLRWGPCNSHGGVPLPPAAPQRLQVGVPCLSRPCERAQCLPLCPSTFVYQVCLKHSPSKVWGLGAV